MDSIQKLGMLVDKLEQLIPQYDKHNATVSSAPAGWHIEHSLLVLDQVIDQMARSEPKHYKKVFDYRRSIVILIGYIPKGKIKAPKAVRPMGITDASTLHTHMQGTRQKIALLSQLDKGSFFTHPFLGDFKLKQAARFLCVHTKHHLGIINEILQSGT